MDKKLRREIRAWEKLSDEAWSRIEELLVTGAAIKKKLEAQGVTEEKLMAEFEEWRRKRRKSRA